MRGKWMAVVALCIVVLSGIVFAEKPARTDFKGTVTDAAGKPVAQATAKLYLLEADRARGYTYRLLGEAVSDADGKVSFQKDVPVVKSYAYYCCLVEKKGLACGWVGMQEPSGVWTITLDKPTSLGGIVNDADGKPIAGASVRLVMLAIAGSHERIMMSFDPINVFVTKTGADGRFMFNNLPADASVEIQVEKDGQGMLHTLDTSLNPEAGLTYKAGQTDIKLTMQAACSITCQVIARDGQQSVTDVPVMIRDSKLPINFFNKPVTSAADGAVVFEGLAPGDYVLTCLSDEWIASPVTVAASTAAPAQATMELTKGGSVEVTVVEEGSQSPVAEVYINLRNSETNQHESMQTNEKGVAKKQVLAGTYQVSAYVQGYRSMNEVGKVVVENGKPATLTVELPEQPKLKVTVTDAAGKPVQGATICIYPGGGRHKAQPVSNEKGQLEYSWDPGQESWHEGDFFLLATQTEKNLAGVVQMAADAKEATVKLEQGVTVKGKVVSPAGEPIVGAKVCTWFDGERFSSSMSGDVTTDAKGQYTLTTLALTQKYSVHVSEAKGYGTGKQAIEPDKGYERTLADIVLPVADQKVTGTVVDLDGQPLAGAQLHCYSSGDDGQPNINTKSDDEGKFVLENVCAGEIRISAGYRNGDNYDHGYVRTEGGAEDVTIVVAPQGGSSRFVPKTAASLVGKTLPELSGCGVDVPAEASRVLVFAWDMSQRPSRHFIKQLATKADLLKEKGVTVLLVQAAPVEKAKLDAWLTENAITWPCGIITEKADATKDTLGIQGLPWLMLTDAEKKVIAEGFKVEELDNHLN